MEFSQFWNRLKIQQKYAIISTFLFGIFSHGAMIFNKFSNHDDLRYMFTGGTTFALGRWALFFAEKLKNLFFQDNLYSIPAVIGFFTFICLAVVSCLLIDLFEIRSVNFSILLSGIMVSIPVLACMFGYMFTAQFYALAILFAVWGPWLILKKKQWYWHLTGTAMMTASLGIYQAYLSIMLSVLLLGLVKTIVEAESTEGRKFALRRLPLCLVCSILALALYFGLMFLSLRINGLQLSDYKGLNSAGMLSFDKYFHRIRLSYGEFFRPEKETPYNVFPGSSLMIYEGLVVFSAFLYMISVIRTLKKSAFCGILLIFCGVLIPVCVNAEFLMADAYDCYAMMVYAVTVFIVFIVWQFQHVIGSIHDARTGLLCFAVTLGLGMMLLVFLRFDNACYTRLEIAQTSAKRFFTSLITRMQSEPGYRASMPVAYIGAPQIVPWDPTLPEKDEFDVVNIYPFWEMRHEIGGPWKSFMSIWFDFSPREAVPADYMNLPEVKAMPCYPEYGSIKVIDDTLVVKLSGD